MLRKLLADRFQLRVHSDQREIKAYVITLAKSGPKLTKTAGGPTGTNIQQRRVMVSRNVTVARFAQTLQSTVFDQPVIDRTGLTDAFDFTLTWRTDESQFPRLGARAGVSPDENAPDLFAALRDQLGLRLESTKALIDVIIIDRVEKPSEN